jgi:transposase-like protein
MNDGIKGQMNIMGGVDSVSPKMKNKATPRSNNEKNAAMLPENLGKAIRMPVPDFSNPDRQLTCLEADFPIAKINGISSLEASSGATRKPIYQMSKWWARRQSSVFRSMLIAAATEAPTDPNESAKLVWEHYYCNHQKAGSYKHLKVLDCFMGGGTTLVEGSRLGMQMTGVDLNPVAWFVVKNELACSDPEQVKALFEEIEQQVKPQIQPFYTTTCPRGHQGRWIEVETDDTVHLDPIELPFDQRSGYIWEGPEVIATFWAKHGPCQAKGCDHRTPIFNKPIISQRKLSTVYAELNCPSCGVMFHAELGETRMAPGAERVVIEGDAPFTELTQSFARLLNDYDQGNANDTWERAMALRAAATQEPGLHCPRCGIFAGKRLANVLDRHAQPSLRATQRKKKDFALKSKPVQMYLLIHPEWMKGASGLVGEKELGGWAGAPIEATISWYENRMENLRLIEVRGSSLPETVILANGAVMKTSQGTAPRKAHFTCASCGREGNTLESVRATKHTSPVSIYALQCHCPQCEAEGYTYGGRYFKAPDEYDLKRLAQSEKECMRQIIPPSHPA